ncbi:hypothetical protein EUX98_g814 [Antrodiella citrinella]|uniref:Beta-glucuronidase C-terminal domain-containing protein n=1 Tax=Antrodiella citrinella TaxID=2447956 RepID=A0A4S4N320_9APHY|nr:hypothetical protein EUX98_g814 [Antrodiella citrinella]
MVVPTLLFLCFSALAQASVTVYHQQPIGQSPAAAPTGSNSVSAPSASYTGVQAYNPRTLSPPPLPQELPPTQFNINLQPTADQVNGLSIQQSGAFFGFSIETSVVTQVLGINSTFIQVPFLNLVQLVVERAGRFHIRIGGNTQETARLTSFIADGKMIEKQGIDPNNPTATPALVYTMEMFYVLSNISALTNVKWFLGIPFNDTANFALEIAQYGEQILGNNLLGLQVANEPDLYARHSHRPQNYTQYDFFGEFGDLIKAMQANTNIPTTNNLVGPNIAVADWTPEMVWDTGFIPAYAPNLFALSVENYPDDNCAETFPDAGLGPIKDPQAEFVKYLYHDAPNAGKTMIQKFLNTAGLAQQAGKPLWMFETNSASCGGFAGISNSFGATLWAIDHGLQMAYSNFSGAMLHIGGQDVSYNPATPPPTGQSTFNQWTPGSIFYSILAVSEAFGTSNQSQIIDITQNTYQPIYAIYDKGNLARVAVTNFLDDPSGANDFTMSIGVGGQALGQANAVPAAVKVKYMRAPSVSELFNITWAGQTLGGMFQCDGRMKGTETIETIPCDQNANVCNIKVPAPGFALVFMSDTALTDSEPSATVTFSTTALTRTMNTATIDAAALETSNGQSGITRHLGSTSKGSSGAGRGTGVVSSVAALGALLAGVVVFFRAFAQ